MQTVLAFVVCAFLFFSLGVYTQRRYGMKSLARKAKEQLDEKFRELLEKADKIKDSAEEELSEQAQELGNLARRIKDKL